MNLTRRGLRNALHRIVGRRPPANQPTSKVTTAPVAPPGFDPESFFKGILWFQKWEIFDGIFTPGPNPISVICDLMQLPADLSGRRILDIGSANGCMSLECERRGAAEVIGITPLDTPGWGHRQLRDLVGATRTQFKPGSVYDLNPDVLGYFDIVLFCGVLYHLRYPMLAIDNIRRVATNEVFIETHISDGGLGRRDQDIPLWRFYRLDELNSDYSNWFGPNIAAVQQAFESAGFATQLLNSGGSRARFHAVLRQEIPEFLNIACQEAESYEVLMDRLFGSRETWHRPVS
jgi:tRNA (mo5U34)-methyltransferase